VLCLNACATTTAISKDYGGFGGGSANTGFGGFGGFGAHAAFLL
jgi:hypothetical protein